MIFMRQSSIIAISIALCFVGGCSKHTKNSSAPNPAPGQLFTISGQLFVKNFYGSGGDSVPLMNRRIFIRADSTTNKDTASYFASAFTDHDGNFSFYVNDPRLRYDLFGNFYDTSSRSFIAFYSVAIVTDSPFRVNHVYPLTAVVDTVDRNGLKLFTMDSIRAAIPGVQVFLYSSSVVANGDSTFTGNGAFARVTTDSLGRAFIGNLPVGTTYINALFILGNNKKLTRYGALTDLAAKGIVTDTIVVK